MVVKEERYGWRVVARRATAAAASESAAASEGV